MFNRFFWLLFAFLIIKGLLIISVIQYAEIGLSPDEAQYWTWSRALDWGYYSKPPAISWEIWLGTKFFGNTELGVRIGSIIIGIGISLGVYLLAKACQLKNETAFWAGMVMAFSPIGVIGSFLAVTDGGLVFFWIIACILVSDALSKNHSPNYLLIGLMIGLGALFKWPMYYFWLCILGFMPFYRLLYSPQLIIGVIISLIGLLPSLIWNSSHGWVTFRHVFATIHENPSKESIHAHFFNGNFFDFLGAQVSLLSPLLFCLFLISFFYYLKGRKGSNPSLLFCASICFIPLIIFLTLSLFKKMQGNWCVFVYPSGFVFLCWIFCDVIKGKAWIAAGLVLSLLLCSFVFAIPYVQSHNILSFNLPYKYNTFRHNVGWNRLGKELKELGYNPNKDFLFGDKYQMSSILSFYGEGQKRAYFFNLQGIRKNQFSYWPSMAEEQLGKTGYFVLAENSPYLEKESKEKIEDYQRKLALYFQKVELMGIKPLFMNQGVMVKGAIIFKCIDYNGKLPSDTNLY